MKGQRKMDQLARRADALGDSTAIVITDEDREQAVQQLRRWWATLPIDVDIDRMEGEARQRLQHL